ncbi:hypothetical protein ENSA5_16790 [Enhygromyxa salina]|uniref:Uncharacterized protein n=1 Tax=Enhygromyxa salina TaxID=215803 RepID=A0A2S9YED3_9BACT|nr:hypothetical protein [Enhygromyxa salina]PRQ03371.1 hypothetical protein ENSA5_16790 [Enhygromyxa salina]
MSGLKLCVLALRANDLDRASAEIGLPKSDVKLLTSLYGSSPDDWKPFARKSVGEYVTDAGMLPVPLTADLYRTGDSAALNRLVRDVELLLIDPVCVVAQIHQTGVVWRLEAVIRRAKLSFCVIYPPRLSQTMKDLLRTKCEEHLPLLTLAPPEEGAWDVSSEGYLKSFLAGLKSRRRPAANPSQVDAVASLLAGAGITSPSFPGTPRLR